MTDMLAPHDADCLDRTSKDPYSEAVRLIVQTLEWALDDGVSGAMSHGEFNVLSSLADRLMTSDPAVEIEPRIG